MSIWVTVPVIDIECDLLNGVGNIGETASSDGQSQSVGKVGRGRNSTGANIVLDLGFEGTVVRDEGSRMVETVRVDMVEHALAIVDWDGDTREFLIAL